jgi:hypothetical protein
LIASLANGSSTGYLQVCSTAAKRPLSVSCWSGGTNITASTQINAAGQVNATNWSGYTSAVYCTIICANIN